MGKHILIIEDDKKLNDGMKLALQTDHYLFTQCRKLSEARAFLKDQQADLVLLDVNLPDGNGIDFVYEIRKTSQVPVILITVNNMELDIVTGLSAGANDYITKPFDIDILIAKINGIFKRKYARDEIICDNIRLNTVTQTLMVDETKVNVTEKEFQLLKLLMENKGITLKKEYLFNNIWGSDSASEMQTLTVHIKWLREKIEQDAKKPKHIITVWGTGYRYE